MLPFLSSYPIEMFFIVFLDSYTWMGDVRFLPNENQWGEKTELFAGHLEEAKKIALPAERLKWAGRERKVPVLRPDGGLDFCLRF